MKKSGDEVLNDLCTLLAGSELIGMISGSLYADATLRPVGSTLEDAVITFGSGTGGQVQRGTVALDIHVPDLTVGNGSKNNPVRYVKNAARTLAISRVATGLLDQQAFGPYLLRFENMVQTIPGEELDEHVVHVELAFSLTAFD